MTTKQQYQRLQALFALSRERYLAAGGRTTGHADGNVYMTPAEKQEFLAIARSLRPSSTEAQKQRQAQAQGG